MAEKQDDPMLNAIIESAFKDILKTQPTDRQIKIFFNQKEEVKFISTFRSVARTWATLWANELIIPVQAHISDKYTHSLTSQTVSPPSSKSASPTRQQEQQGHHGEAANIADVQEAHADLVKAIGLTAPTSSIANETAIKLLKYAQNIHTYTLITGDASSTPLASAVNAFISAYNAHNCKLYFCSAIAAADDSIDSTPATTPATGASAAPTHSTKPIHSLGMCEYFNYYKQEDGTGNFNIKLQLEQCDSYVTVIPGLDRNKHKGICIDIQYM